jgi:hypothetical protein
MGRMSFSNVWVNSRAVLGFRFIETLRAYMIELLGNDE